MQSDSWTAGRGFKTSCCLRKFSVTYFKDLDREKRALVKFLGPNPVKYFSISIKSAQEFTGELIGWKLPLILKSSHWLKFSTLDYVKDISLVENCHVSLYQRHLIGWKLSLILKSSDWLKFSPLAYIKDVWLVENCHVSQNWSHFIDWKLSRKLILKTLGWLNIATWAKISYFIGQKYHVIFN